MATLPSDLEIADLLYSQYYTPQSTNFQSFTDDGVYWSLKHCEELDLILLRGSTTLEDWLRDLMAVANPLMHGKLGAVHPGFLVGMDDVWKHIRKVSKGPWVVAGHSLGAGRAAILSGLMCMDGADPLRKVVFGEPKPGFRMLYNILSNVPGENYRNGDSFHHDLITDVPLSFPPEEYVHSAPLTFVSARPGPDVESEWGIFAWHHMGLYRQALGSVTLPPGGTNAKAA